MKHYFSVGETARALGVTERTVWNYIKKGELKTVKKNIEKPGESGSG